MIVDFISCVTFRKTANFIEKYGVKGTKYVLKKITNWKIHE